MYAVGRHRMIGGREREGVGSNRRLCDHKEGRTRLDRFLKYLNCQTWYHVPKNSCTDHYQALLS